MNPLKPIPSLFGPELVRMWHEDPHGDVCLSKVHAYTVAEKAYRGMSEKQIDQSILVSGMSGAGKSETVKICINYLSSIGGGQSDLERHINDAGLVLESFGNSFTVHNSNSSRFGKFTKMFFEHGKSMVGAKITTYLLEKTRVAHPPENERNFHIFYQMLHGMSDELKLSLHLTKLSDYQILKTQPLPDRASFASEEQAKIDAETYTSLLERLSGLGIDEESVNQLFRVLSGLLHLGNVRFVETVRSDASSSSGVETDDGISSVENPDVLKVAADLLGVDADALEVALTKLSMKSLGNTLLPLSRAKAELSRDSLLGETHERIFEWLVERLNESLETELDEDDLGYVAILDISGYESVAKNGFEQMNINYTNDKLMQLYNEMLYREQELYRREFGWDPVEIDSDLKDVIALIEKKPEGVLPLLDMVCYRQNASDNLFVNELSNFSIGTPRANTRCIHLVNPDSLLFSVHHAPGAVEYFAKGFVVKNRDILASSLEQLMKSSKNELCEALFAKPGEKGQTSAAKFYIEQLADLMDAIRETDYSFIKCIKPNALSKPDFMDKAYIADQIKWSGVMDTLLVCSRGFPEHCEYQQFVDEFSSLESADELHVQRDEGEEDEEDGDDDDEEVRRRARAILAASLGETEMSTEAAFGKTKLFLSMSAMFKLITMKRTKAQLATNQDGGWLAKAKSAFGWLWSASSASQ